VHNSQHKIAGYETKIEDNPCQLVGMWPIEVVQKNLIYMISELLSREETMMKQSSRVQWLAKGDQNTKA
jgi:hypothetical protein